MGIMRTISIGLLLTVSAAMAGTGLPIIFDTDFGGDADDLGALAMLHRFIDTGECNVLAVMCCKSEQYAVPAIDAVNRYYKHPDIPIGVLQGGTYYSDWNYSKVVADRFRHTMEYADAEDALELYRRILAAADDHSIVIVTVGPLSNIRNLIESPGGQELIERKVKEFVIMGGQFPSGTREANFHGHTAGLTKFVLNNIKVPVTFLGYELGVRIKTGEGITDPETPLYVGYMHFFQHAPWMKKNFTGEMGRNASFDQTAVLYAVRGGVATWWTRSEAGTCIADASGGNQWVEDPAGSHTYLKLAVEPESMATRIENIMLHNDAAKKTLLIMETEHVEHP